MKAFLPRHRLPFTIGVAVLSAALFAPLLSPAAAGVSNSRGKLLEVERTLDQERTRRQRMERTAEVYADDRAALKRRLVAAAQRAQDHEAKISDLEHRIAALREQDRDIRASLAERHRHSAIMLAALQRLARNPPATLIMLPADPADTVRSAILLRGAVPRLEAQAAALRDELWQMANLRQRIAVERRHLVTAGTALEGERRELAELIGRKARLERRARVDSAEAGTRIAELATQARSIQELLDRLAITRKRLALTRPALPKAAPPARSRALFPARGRVVRRFGHADQTGTGAKGITLETRTAAQVVAPVDGLVVFAGSFRGYGRLLIIENGEGYHMLMAGLARLDAAVGDEVLEGEPVGIMDPGSGVKPNLYFELRRDGRPVNPLPWLAATKDKVSG